MNESASVSCANASQATSSNTTAPPAAAQQQCSPDSGRGSHEGSTILPVFTGTPVHATAPTTVGGGGGTAINGGRLIERCAYTANDSSSPDLVHANLLNVCFLCLRNSQLFMSTEFNVQDYHNCSSNGSYMNTYDALISANDYGIKQELRSPQQQPTSSSTNQHTPTGGDAQFAG